MVGSRVFFFLVKDLLILRKLSRLLDLARRSCWLALFWLLVVELICRPEVELRFFLTLAQGRSGDSLICHSFRLESTSKFTGRRDLNVRNLILPKLGCKSLSKLDPAAFLFLFFRVTGLSGKFLMSRELPSAAHLTTLLMKRGL